MPTSLPVLFPAEIVGRTNWLPRAIWLVAIWAIVMLSFGTLANIGAETGAMDPFQLLATF
jgi:hypothetical protein